MKKESIEQELFIAAKMHRCRNAAKQLFSQEYKKKVEFYIDVIKMIMAKHKLDVLPAVLKIIEDPTIAGNEIAVMMLMSATLDIIDEQCPAT